MAGKSCISRAENLNTGHPQMTPKFVFKFDPKSARKFSDRTNRYKDMEDLIGVLEDLENNKTTQQPPNTIQN